LAAHRDPERGDGYEGLNLTRATLNASLKYPRLRDVENPGTKAWRKYGAYDSDQDALKFARELGPPGDGQALEAAIMDYADDVAYSVHDLEDFFRAGLIPITLLSKDRNVFAAFIDAWCADPLSSMTAERVAPHRDTLLRMLEDLFPFDAGYRDTFEHRASLRTASSSLIQRCVWEAHIAAPGSPQPLDIAEEIRVQLKFLQRLVWAHVIQNPRLATQQHGQRQIIRTLFEIYLGAINVRNRALVPPLFHRPLAKLGASAETATRKSANTPEETRLAVDIIASFSDDQAILLYRRLTGVATGSVTDYLAS
jgi:dGTPase